jgi:hypothetical protein
MVEPLPERDFRFLSEDELRSFDYESVPDDAPDGYILEVDLKYPESKELHDLFSDYPPCPENATITVDDLSPYTKKLAEKLNVRPKSVDKLVCNLKDKCKYVLHYRNLKLYKQLGMKVVKIHRVLKFKQSKWMKPYVEFNIEKRKQATNDFEKDFFKLMNNAVFGKTMENIRKHKDVKLVDTVKKFNKLVARPNFKSFKIFSEDLTAVHMTRIEICLDKPTYVGMSILDISKLFMFKFHYGHIKKLYGNRAALLMTDTDSLIYDIQTDDVYEDMRRHLDLYDTSDYPRDHPAYSDKNKKALGKMKDETKGNPIKEFVGLRPKMYSILEKDDVNAKKTAKGISKSARKRLRHRQYYDALFNEESNTVEMAQIRSHLHEIRTVKIKKTGLSPYDDKRYVLNDKITTLAHGHYETK